MSYQPIISSREQMVELRKLLGLTQTELADRLGMSLRAIQELENGRAELRPIHMLAMDRIATAFTVQTYTNGVANLEHPSMIVAAIDHDQAAARVCGTDLVSSATTRGKDLKTLVAKVWMMGPNWKPVIRWYFRP